MEDGAISNRASTPDRSIASTSELWEAVLTTMTMKVMETKKTMIMIMMTENIRLMDE